MGSADADTTANARTHTTLLYTPTPRIIHTDTIHSRAMLLECHHSDQALVRNIMLESDEEEPPSLDRLRLTTAMDKRRKGGCSGGVSGHHGAISEYDSESSSENDEALSLSSEECGSISRSCSSSTTSSSSRGVVGTADDILLNPHQQDLNESTTTTSSTESASLPAPEIREVWASNLYEEFSQICRLVSDYPFVAMDTEFPGIVAKPMGNFSSMDEYKYQLVKCNVDLLKMIQLGITLLDAQGNRPPGVCTWQFNFKFSLREDLYAEESIDLLMNSGLRFDRHSADGVAPSEFAAMLLTSGLVLMDNVTWLTFHSAYDFGYLLRQLTCQQLPESETEFLESLRIYFPNMYDIKYLMTTTDSLNGGLQKVANELRVKRIGSQHQAGSDSLLTGQVFFKMYKEYFRDGLDDLKYNGYICGLGGTSSSGSHSATGGMSSANSTPSKLQSHHHHRDESLSPHGHRHHHRRSPNTTATPPFGDLDDFRVSMDSPVRVH